jgi:hypothetical protein
MASRWISDLVGTLKTSFRIGKGALDFSGTSAVTTLLRSNNSGVLINDSLGWAFNSQSTMGIVYVTADRFRFKGTANGPEFYFGSSPAPYMEGNSTATSIRVNFDASTSVTNPGYAWAGSNKGTGFYLKTAYASATVVGAVAQEASTAQGQDVWDFGEGFHSFYKALASTAGFLLNFKKSRGNTYGPTAITSGDTIGTVGFSAYTGGTGLYVEAARIVATNVGTVSNNSTGAGGKIEIYTRESGQSQVLAQTIDEKARTKVRTLVPTVQAPSFSATPTIDPNAGSTWDMTLTGNVTACTVSAGQDGQKLTLRLKQDGTGSRTFAFDSSVAFGTDITAITLTTTANKTDLIGLEYNATAAKWWVAAFTKGF